MTTVPVPVKGMPPKVHVIAPVDASAVNVTGVPISALTLDCVTVPASVTVFPDTEPVSGNWHTAGLAEGLGVEGGESVPPPDNDEAVPEA